MRRILSGRALGVPLRSRRCKEGMDGYFFRRQPSHTGITLMPPKSGSVFIHELIDPEER